jgi:hypothetical protein
MALKDKDRYKFFFRGINATNSNQKLHTKAPIIPLKQAS